LKRIDIGLYARLRKLHYSSLKPAFTAAHVVIINNLLIKSSKPMRKLL